MTRRELAFCNLLVDVGARKRRVDGELLHPKHALLIFSIHRICVLGYLYKCDDA